MPTFSIIIPVKPSGEIKALDSLRNLIPGPYPFEVLVAEGAMPSRQRNLAARQAEGEILYFLDDDSLMREDNLALCAALFEDSAVAVAGGPSLTPHSDSFLQQIFGLALGSRFGAGSMLNRYQAVGNPRETTEQELILCNLAIRRDVFLESGGFDERLYPNEENELLDRIMVSHKLVHHPGMAVWRSQRASLTLFMRQMFAYGRGRAQQTLLVGPRSIMSFLPLFFVLYLFLALLLPDVPIRVLPLILYIVGDLFSTLSVIIRTRNLGAILLLLIFPIMHVCNGLGLLRGFIGGKPGAAGNNPVALRKVKSFEQLAW